MRNGFYVAILTALTVFAAEAAFAAPVAPVMPAGTALPLHLSSVFCNARGCQPVTRVKRCSVNSNQNSQQGQDGIRRTCNF